MKKKTTQKQSTPTAPVVRVRHDHDPLASQVHAFFQVVRTVLLLFILSVLGATTVLGYKGYRYVHTVAQTAGMSTTQLIRLAWKGWDTTPTQTDSKTNILLLGVDALSNRSEDHINTDTMMLVSLNLHSGIVNTISFQRDLFLKDVGMKINGIYDDARQKQNPHPEQATASEIEKISGVPIHATIVMQLSTLQQAIDAIGGLDIGIAHSFTDEQFPRPDVDVTTVHDPKLLYETVSFAQGVEHMDGARALVFIRSRHSKDPIEGTDDARAKRQQEVIEALIKKFQDPSILRNPVYAGKLLKLYQQDIASSFPLEQAIGIGKVFVKSSKKPVMSGHILPVKDTDQNPVLYHPATFPSGAWVYLPIDPTLKAIQTLIHTWLQ